MREIAGQVPQNSEVLIRHIVRQVMGEEVRSLTHIVGRGFNNAVTVAATACGDLVVRTNVEAHLFRFEREAWCLQEVGYKGVPVPEVLGCGIALGHSFSVARFVDGSETIGSKFDELRVWRTLGEYAEILNSIEENVVDSAPETARLFPIRWKEQVTADVNLIFKDNWWSEQALLTAEQQQLLEAYLHGSSDDPGRRGVCQFDLALENALIRESDNDCVVLIDLEWANIAPVPNFQLACVAAVHGLESDVTKAFFEGYKHDLPRTPSEHPQFFRLLLLRVMRATAWARERAPALLDENIRRTLPILRAVLESS